MFVFHHLADDGGLSAQRMTLHYLQQLLTILRFADTDQLALIGDIEGIEAQQFTGGGNSWISGIF